MKGCQIWILLVALASAGGAQASPAESISLRDGMATTSKSAIFASFLSASEGSDAAISVTNTLGMPMEPSDMAARGGSDRRGPLEFYLFAQDGTRLTFRTSESPGVGSGVDANGELGPRGTYTVLLSEILEAIPGAPSSFSGTAVVVGCFDAVGGTVTNFFTALEAGNAFVMTPPQGGRPFGAQTQTTQVIRFFAAPNIPAEPDPLPGSKATVTRRAEGATVSVSANFGRPGAYTIWAVVFNRPEYCVVAFNCGEDDISPDSPARPGVFLIDGFVVEADGQVEFTASMPVGELPSGEGQVPLPNAHALEYPFTAEIHGVARFHGEASDDPETLERQTSTVSGNCEALAEGDCWDPFAWIFRPLQQ